MKFSTEIAIISAELDSQPKARNKQRTEALFAHLNERGVLEWDSASTYLAGAMVWSNGKVYKARQTSTNQAVTLTSYWQEQSLPDMPASGDGFILYYNGAKLYWKDQS